MEYEIIGPAPTSLGLKPFGQIFKKTLSQAEYVSIAVAYLHGGALDVVGPRLSQVLNRKGQIDIIIGIQNSSVKALRGLASIVGTSNLSLYWQRGQGNYHPKIYLVANGKTLDSAKQLDVFVGSSNLTGAGLEHNLEINVHFKMTKPSDSLEIIKWKSYWSKIRGLPGVHPYSDKLVSELEKRGVFKQVRNMINLNDLFPANDTSLYPIVTGTIYVQTLQPNDFPATGESDAIVPRAARRVNEAFWGWDKLFNTSPGGHKQRLFPNTTLRYNGGEVKTNCRLYEVDSVSNFRLTCPAVRSLLPIDHHDYLFTVQIQGKNCDIRFISPNDPDYWDYYASTRPLGNSDKRWGYI